VRAEGEECRHSEFGSRREVEKCWELGCGSKPEGTFKWWYLSFWGACVKGKKRSDMKFDS
jgi:hypothetical protein